MEVPEVGSAAGPAAGFHALSRSQLIGTIVGLQLMLLLAALDQTVVGTAMPRIIAHLNGFDRYAWVTTAYLLTSTTAVPIFGKLSDMYGRKWFFLGGAVLFVATSALCGAAGDLPLPGDGMSQLIFFRGLQGLAGGILTGLVFTIIGDIFAPADRGKYQGLFTGVWGLASVIGPTLGGWLTDNFSWRAVFYVNLPVGVVAVVVVAVAFPYFPPDSAKRSIDYLGVTTLVAGLVPLLLALTWSSQYGWTSPRVLALLGTFVVMTAAFMLAESRAVEPILPLSLFTSRIVVVSAFALFLTGMGMFGSILFIPLFMQGVSGVSATNSGALLIPMTLALMIGSIVSGQLLSRVGRYKRIALIGLSLMTGGMFLLSRMDASTSQGVVVRNMLVVGFGLGLVMPLYTVVVQNAVPHRMIGVATATTQFFRSIGGTVGAAVFGSVMLNRYTSHFSQETPAQLRQLVPDQGRLAQILAPFQNPLQLTQVLPELQRQFGTLPGGQSILSSLLGNVRSALVYSLDGVFLTATFLVAIAFIANLFLPEITLRKGTRSEPAAQPVVTTAAREYSRAEDRAAVGPSRGAD